MLRDDDRVGGNEKETAGAPKRTVKVCATEVTLAAWQIRTKRGRSVFALFTADIIRVDLFGRKLTNLRKLGGVSETLELIENITRETQK